MHGETNTGAAADQQIKQLQERVHALEQMNLEKNKLLSIVSHDLRSPIDSIKSYLELLAENVLTSEERAQVEGQLAEQTRYTSDLLTNMLSWVKSQMGGVTVNLVPVKVKEVVDLIAGNKLTSVARKGIKLTYSINSSLEVIADFDMLKIVLRNLVNNAIKFTKPGGEITIKAERKGSEVTISVTDTGIGIPADKQEEIFSTKIHSTYGTDNEKGIGLGLVMCREFMHYQNGKIGFESTENVGTRFYIVLPSTLR
ncbi:MAG: rcsC 1 [Flavipsychrobacter sp.]|nr:rcsC 1 [Flavipsychrobacter sp.]